MTIAMPIMITVIPQPVHCNIFLISGFLVKSACAEEIQTTFAYVTPLILELVKYISESNQKLVSSFEY